MSLGAVIKTGVPTHYYFLNIIVIVKWGQILNAKFKKKFEREGGMFSEIYVLNSFYIHDYNVKKIHSFWGRFSVDLLF